MHCAILSIPEANPAQDGFGGQTPDLVGKSYLVGKAYFLGGIGAVYGKLALAEAQVEVNDVFRPNEQVIGT